MAKDNTSVVDDSKASDIAITDQKTLEEALTKPEPVEEVEDSTEETKTQEPSEKEEKKEFKFLGKYKSEEDAHKAFAEIQERARKAEERVKEIEKKENERAMQDFKNMDYEQQMEFLVKRDKEKQEALEKLYSALNEQVQAEDKAQLDKFIDSEPLIKETGLENEFRLLATHPELQQYSYESIFKTLLKPKVEKIMGTKITVKERKILSNTATPQVDEFSPENISQMSPQEYEKNREKILKASGIRI